MNYFGVNRNGFIISTLANTGVTFVDMYLQNTEARRYTNTHTLTEHACNVYKYEQKKHTDIE